MTGLSVIDAMQTGTIGLPHQIAGMRVWGAVSLWSHTVGDGTKWLPSRGRAQSQFCSSCCPVRCSDRGQGSSEMHGALEEVVFSSDQRNTSRGVPSVLLVHRSWHSATRTNMDPLRTCVGTTSSIHSFVPTLRCVSLLRFGANRTDKN